MSRIHPALAAFAFAIVMTGAVACAASGFVG